MTTIAAFGIGSTNFRYAIGTSAGALLSDISVEPTAPARLLEQFRDALTALQTRSPQPIDAVSISVAGLVDHERATLEEIDTTDGTPVTDIPIGELVHDEFGLPVYLENDCNASAIAEYVFGAGREYDHSSLVHVTFGTGIGAGIIDNGRLVRGADGQSAEVGLIPLGVDAPVESFGVPGAWEAFCSGRGIPRYVATQLAEESRATTLTDYDPLTAEAVFEAADGGDTVAEEHLDRIDQYNAAGLGTLCNLCNPSLITLGGGVALNNPERILDGILRYIDDYTFVERPEIGLTELGDFIGLYGALGHAAFASQSRSTLTPDGPADD